MARKPKAEPVAERAEICKNCRWSEFGEVFHCHRLPPKPLFDISDGVVASYFPVVKANSWCGEFSPKLDS